ncbi:hypothetical protein IF650_12535 [Cellulosimicrobium terreum]|nr:hypothetical protein [Cellulosimicrobium terreum]
MSEVVFARENVWLPQAVREDGELRLSLGAGADANHEPRTFSFPIEDTHLAVIREDLTRHLLLTSAVLPLCDAAGIRGPLDQDAAVALLDPILLSAPAEVDAYFRRIRWGRDRLVAHGADTDLLESRQVYRATCSATESLDWRRVQVYVADRGRAGRSVILPPLDTALLTFTGHDLYGARGLRRLPEAVDPALLPDVERVIATAEHACTGMRVGRGPRRGRDATNERDWDEMAAKVGAAVRRAYPELLDEAVRTVTLLMCAEAAGRAEGARRGVAWRARRWGTRS